MKIVNFKKFTRSILILLGIIFLISLVINKSTLSHAETSYKIIYVSSNDTLWNIATTLQSGDFYKGKDVRYIIDNLMKINNLSSSSIYPNQELKVPIV